MYRYILRYYIDPGFHEAERIAELADFCVDSAVDEVMLFLNPEELFTGYWNDAELDAWLDTAGKAASVLRGRGVEFSVNPWTTIVHCARGRGFGEVGKNFTALVGENGLVSKITSCPLCSNWQEFICRQFSRIAERLHPTAIWIEDDWRLHNHGVEFGYGGCFCKLHMARFAELAGTEVSREELLAKILAPGEPHPWRKLWLQVCRESLLEPARRLREAVPAEVKLGLMSSVPDVQASEGRDWHQLQNILSPCGALLSRPHLPPYSEARALIVPPVQTRLTIANFARPVEIYPELENSPRCGRYSKSAAFSAWEILCSVCYGSRGITINHYDMMGNGIALDPGFGRMLAAIKPRLSAVEKLGLDDDGSIGATVLFKPRISESVHTAQGRSMSELCPRSAVLGEALVTLGMSVRFATEVTPGRLTALCSQTARALSDAELDTLLSGPCLIDAETADILISRGRGELIGVESGTWTELEESGFAYEETASGRRMCAQRCSQGILLMVPAEGARMESAIFRFDRTAMGPGALTFENRLGGRIVSIAYKVGTAEFFMAWFTVFRRDFMLKLLKNIASGEFGCAISETPLHLYMIRQGGRVFAAVGNPTPDTAEGFEIDADFLPGRARRLTASGEWVESEFSRQGGRLRFERSIAPLDVEYMLFE